MAEPLNHKQLWSNLRLRTRGPVVEVWERRPGESVAFLLIAFGPGSAFSALYYLAFGLDWIGVAIAIGMFAVLGLLARVVYNTPRSLRLFPGQQLAEVSRHFFGLRYRARWHDINQEEYEYRAVEVLINTGDESWFGILIGFVHLFSGPIGLLLAPLTRCLFKDKQRMWAYALVPAGKDQPRLIVLSDAHFIRRMNQHVESVLVELRLNAGMSVTPLDTPPGA